jgi:hypothetical protein
MTPDGVLVRQLAAVDAWNSARPGRERAILAGRGSRQQGADADRRLFALRRTHGAIVGCAARALAGQTSPMPTFAPVRAVLAHRDDCFAGRLAHELEAPGVAVTVVADGAEAAGTAVAEQPELLLVEETLTTLPGRDVVIEAARFCPAPRILARVAGGERVGGMLDAGARTAVVRQVPPAGVAEEATALLARHV